MKDVGLQAQSIASILKIWRRSLPHNLAWHDEDPPSTDINVARLRAKYTWYCDRSCSVRSRIGRVQHASLPTPVPLPMLLNRQQSLSPPVHIQARWTRTHYSILCMNASRVLSGARSHSTASVLVRTAVTMTIGVNGTEDSFSQISLALCMRK
jgi:hypothetical protein